MAAVRLRLGPRLFLGFLGVIALGQAITATLVDRNVQRAAAAQVRERLAYEVTMLGQITANALFGPLDPNDKSLSGVVKQLADSVHTDLALVATDGTVVADSSVENLSKVENQANAPEIVGALRDGKGLAIRAAGQKRMFVAEAIVRDGATLGIARASVPLGVVAAIARNTRRQMAYGALSAAGLAALVAAVLALGILRPIRRLADAARRVGGGDLQYRVDVGVNDEIGALGTALNDMVARVQSMVEALDRRNREMRVVLDNVAQGLVTVGRDGGIGEERSRAIDRWFRAPTAGTKLWDMLGDLDPKVRTRFSLGWEQLFEEVLPTPLALAQIPSRVRAGQRWFELTYEPLTGPSRAASYLVVLSDVTAAVAAEEAQAEQREKLRLFEAVARDPNGVIDFLRETGAKMNAVLSNPEGTSLAETNRAIHTIKGSASLFGLTRLSTLCDRIETRLADPSDGTGLLVGEREALAGAWRFVKTCARDMLGELGTTGAVDVTEPELGELLSVLEKSGDSKSAGRLASTWRLERAERRMSRIADQTRILAARLGKDGVRIRVEVVPPSLRFPKLGWGPFWAALPHVLRNALDHGIEPADERVARGKPPAGELRLSARAAGDDSVLIEVSDDGRGISWSEVRRKGEALGMPSQTDADLRRVLFADGVTTRTSATEFSGRGLGLGEVARACEAIGARYEVESGGEKGGTVVRFFLPLSELSEESG